MKNCIFKNNISGNGGAIYAKNVNCVIEGSTFENNLANEDGAAVHFSSDVPSKENPVEARTYTFTKSSCKNNEAKRSGGCLFTDLYNITIG